MGLDVLIVFILCLSVSAVGIYSASSNSFYTYSYLCVFSGMDAVALIDMALKKTGLSLKLLCKMFCLLTVTGNDLFTKPIASLLLS